MKKLIFKNALITRSFFAFLLIATIFPIFFITKYCGEGGRIAGSILFIIIGIIGYVEVLKVLKISLISALITSLVIPIFVFIQFDSYKVFVKFGDDTSIAVAILQSLRYWQTWLIPIAFIFVPFISDKILFNKNPNFFSFIVVVFMSFLIPIFTKTIWILNIWGIKYVLFFVGIAIFSDTFSYLGGMYFGKKLFRGAKFAPNISPKKTWAGYIIGSTITCLYAVLLGYFLNIWSVFGDYELLIAIIFGIAISFLTPYGDLLFSLVKRKSNVKDFSNLIPGHGGIFDRIDALSIVIVLCTFTFLIANLS